MARDDDTPRLGVQRDAPPPQWHDLPDSQRYLHPVPPPPPTPRQKSGRPSWASGPVGKVSIIVIAGLLVALITGAVVMYAQGSGRSQQVREVRERQTRHERRSHPGTAKDIGDLREDVADLRGDVRALRGSVEDMQDDARETRDDVEWIRRRMGGGD